MKKNLLLIALIICSFCIKSNAQSENEEWVKIANKTVAYKAETDKINMFGKTQKLSKIKLTCTQGTVKLKKIRVKMSDGTEKEYDPKGTGVFSKGMSSFAFQLPGKDAKLESIEIDYDSVGNIVLTKKAKVEIWGKKRKEKED